MASFAKTWQDEVRRLARKELKLAVDSVRQDNVELKRQNALLRRRLELLERNLGRTVPHAAIRAAAPKPPTAAPVAEAGGEDSPKLRITSKTVRTLRDKLGLTQADFATLLGVTGQSIYHWEHKGGRIHMRRATVEAFARIRDIGAREARRRLDALTH